MLAKEQPQLQVILPQEVQDQIYQLFVVLAREAINEVTNTHRKRYVSQNELCKLMHCSHAVVKEWIAQGLPYFNKGNSIMFVLDEVDTFIRTKLMQ